MLYLYYVPNKKRRQAMHALLNLIPKDLSTFVTLGIFLLPSLGVLGSVLLALRSGEVIHKGIVKQMKYQDEFWKQHLNQS